MNSKKIILMSLIFILCMCIFSVDVFADSIDTLISNMKTPTDGGGVISAGDTSGGGIMDAINTILGLVQVAGTGVALIAVSLLGIKYMLASVEEKAEIKKYLIGAVIGGILVFGGTGIAKVLANFSTGLFGSGEAAGGE